MREFHLIIKSTNGVIVHRKLDVNDAITLQSTDTILYQEMVDINTMPATLALNVHADGIADGEIQ